MLGSNSGWRVPRRHFAHRPPMRLLSALLLLVCAPPLLAQPTPWPTELKRYYLTQCQSGLRAEGMGPTRSGEVCQCMASGLSQTFGLEGFDNMQTAQSNPRGSVNDRAFYRVAHGCLYPTRVGQ